eukprot:CAMPEP_0202454864 /NCGR_PEP_ID=MMETSP1360-20130828/12512_1 /ASSEMBLY_ACC=CAM_ASM_000848 /TAXON_ID=515479 /ORGANISM="Licmophora paradoxa, Strain CCMP2313" /LENGTH=230 /DNA_ID=CAMNT_0049074291 /DNA_START=54 /DNA_END=746 /DNA_ORIENTATION=+
MTMYIAWLTKDVQTELSESNWIFYAIFSHLQTWVVGIPLFVILDRESADAAYLIRVFFAFIFSTVTVALIIWPKMYVWMLDGSSQAEKSRSRGSVNITGKAQHHISGITSPHLSKIPQTTSNDKDKRQKGEESASLTIHTIHDKNQSAERTAKEVAPLREGDSFMCSNLKFQGHDSTESNFKCYSHSEDSISLNAKNEASNDRKNDSVSNNLKDNEERSGPEESSIPISV